MLFRSQSNAWDDSKLRYIHLKTLEELQIGIITFTLKKEHNAIAYHSVREAVAAGIIHITKVPTETNLADMLTKPLPGPRLRELCQIVVY